MSIRLTTEHTESVDIKEIRLTKTISSSVISFNAILFILFFNRFRNVNNFFLVFKLQFESSQRKNHLLRSELSTSLRGLCGFIFLS
jgi:hypothetical protein